MASKLPGNGNPVYYEVNFLSTVAINKVTTQGSIFEEKYWMETYEVKYSLGDGSYKTVQDHNGYKIFTGNTNHNDTVTNIFDSVVIAQYAEYIQSFKCRCKSFGCHKI